MKKTMIIALVLPLMAEISYCSQIITTAKPTVMNGAKSEIIEAAHLTHLKKTIENLKKHSPESIYECLRYNQKEISHNKNILELYYVLRSVARAMPKQQNQSQTLNQLIEMTDALKFLIENPEKQRINEKLKHLRVLLQQFVHLNADQRKTTLAIAENINNALYQAELNNESGPEDGSNFINPGILNEQIERAKAIQNQIDQLEANVHDLEKNFDKISNEEKVERIKEANDFRNGLSSMTFSIQNNEPIPVSRNLRKYLMDKLQISINKMMEQSPYFQTK